MQIFEAMLCVALRALHERNHLISLIPKFLSDSRREIPLVNYYIPQCFFFRHVNAFVVHLSHFAPTSIVQCSVSTLEIYVKPKFPLFVKLTLLNSSLSVPSILFTPFSTSLHALLSRAAESTQFFMLPVNVVS